MQRNYVVEAVFILLGLALVAAILRYPRDIFVNLPVAIFKRIMRRGTNLLSLLTFILLIPVIIFDPKGRWKFTQHIFKMSDFGRAADDDKPYRADRRRKLDFAKGSKSVMILSTDRSAIDSVADFLGALTQKFTIRDFSFMDVGDQTIIRCPQSISFYDFHLLVQHINDEFGKTNSFGVFVSPGLRYCVFQDPNTLNNLVGFTSGNDLFSIYMLDDLDKKQYLRMNKWLEIDKAWIEQATHAITARERDLA